MKKIYLSAAALLAGSLLNAQSSFTWDVTSYKGAFPVTDNTPATDWTSGWANWDPENTNYAAPTSTLTGDVTTNTSISGVVYLDGFVHVTNNAVLTIAPGTIIRCKPTDVSLTPGTLIITRGAKIMAQGTASQPIVFTSANSVATGRNPGDWGGVILCGNGVINTGGISTNPNVSKVEGFVTVDPKRYYGGSNDADNSGVLSYIRIEFAGVALDPLQSNSEINGLTLAGVGSGTQIDHIQVSFSGDDSFEWFGGTVDAKYLIAYRGTDDDFDTDFGFRGRVQFGLGVKDPNIWDVIAGGASNGFECDNNGTSPYLALPLTKAVFSNMTMIGAKGDGTVYGAGSLPTGEAHECGAHIRRNAAQSVRNSLFLGYEKGFRFQNAVTLDNMNAVGTDSMAFYSNDVITAEVASTFITESATVYTQNWYHTYAASQNIDTISTISQINFVNAFTALGTTPDYRLNANSTVATGADFTNLCTPVSVNASTVSPICANQTLNLQANVSGSSPITYTWTGSGSIASANSASTSVTGASTGNYTLNATNTCGTASTVVNVTVNSLPTVTIGTFSAVCVSAPNFTLTNGLPVGGTYSGNGVTTGVFSPSSAGVGTQTITYSYTDVNGCSNSASNNILVNACTGINNVEVQNKLVMLYPNPTSNQTSLIINSDVRSKISVLIYDYTGKLVLNPIKDENITEGKHEFNIDTENLSNGIYLVNIITNSSKETKKLIINK